MPQHTPHAHRLASQRRRPFILGRQGGFDVAHARAGRHGQDVGDRAGAGRVADRKVEGGRREWRRVGHW